MDYSTNYPISTGALAPAKKSTLSQLFRWFTPPFAEGQSVWHVKDFKVVPAVVREAGRRGLCVIEVATGQIQASVRDLFAAQAEADDRVHNQLLMWKHRR